MNILKELHLGTRLVFVAIVTVLFAWVNQADIVQSFVSFGWLVLLISLYLQYYKYHRFVFKSEEAPTTRVKFLFPFFVFLNGVMFICLYKMNNASEGMYYDESLDILGSTTTIYGVVYFIISSLALGLLCTYLHYKKHSAQ